MKGIIDRGDMQDIQQSIYIVQEKIKILEKEEDNQITQDSSRHNQLTEGGFTETFLGIMK